MIDINTSPITVNADHDGIKICGLTDATEDAQADEFVLDLFTHAEAVMFMTHLRRAQDDIDDADPIGALLINGRVVGRPWIVVRMLLQWTSEQPPAATAAVVLVAEVHGDSRFARLTLSVDTVAKLRADIEAAVPLVPAESEFHVWDDMPGRAFDPYGGRDWVFEEYLKHTSAV